MATTKDNSITDEIQLYTIGAKSATCLITVDVQINGKQLPMVVDTGAALSIISEQTWKKNFPGITLKKADVVLKTYTNERMTMMGELLVQVATSISVNTCPLFSSLEMGPVC